MSTSVVPQSQADNFKLDVNSNKKEEGNGGTPKAKWGIAKKRITALGKAKPKAKIDLLVEDDEHSSHHAHGHHGHSKWGKYMIHPNNPLKRAWDVGTIMFVLYLCWQIPFSLGFPHWYGQKTLKPFSIFMDWWFGIDIILTFCTGFVHDGHLIMDPKATAHHYFEFWFWIDVFASIPFEMFMQNTDKNSRKSIKMVKWFKIPRLLRIGRLLKKMKGYARFYKVFLAIALFLWMVHFLGCIWMSIVSDCGDDPVKYKSPTTCSFIWSHYATALDFGAMALLGSSAERYEGDEWSYPAWEDAAGMHAFHCASGAFGLLLIAWIFGEASVILHNIDPSGWDFFGRLDRIKSEMTVHNLPEDLQHSITRFYDYIYMNNRHGQLSLMGDPDMSVSLRQKIALHLHQDALLDQDLFKHASKQCLTFVCERMILEIHMPGEDIIRAGDNSSEKMDLKMYIIKRGKLAVLDGKGSNERQVALLNAGMAFGEMAMLCPGLPRTKTIRTETICELYSLTYHDFHQMMELFPNFAKDMRKLAVDRGLSEEMLANLPKIPSDVTKTNLETNVVKEKTQQEQLEEAIYQMNRLDRQLVAIADTLRTLHRRT